MCVRVCVSLCVASERQYTGCHCLCGCVVEEEVVEGETEDKEGWKDVVSDGGV